jgi:hypothetical protein
MRKDTVRLFKSDGGFCRWIDHEEARRHVSTLAADEIFDNRYNPPKFLGVQLRDMHQPSLGSSATAITAHESLANVGIYSGPETIDEETGKFILPGFVIASRSKIGVYAQIGDDKAVRVSCLARA